MAVKTRLISFTWGFAEATFFFLVPDIWLSRIVLKDRKEAYINIAFTTFGALLGGSLMYFLATAYFKDIQNFLNLIPGISSPMVANTGHQIQSLGFWQALFSGITSGIPYKIYASWSGTLSLSFWVFLLASAAIRTLRFTVVTGAAHMASLVLKPHIHIKHLHVAHIFCWVIFYIFYFYKIGS